MKRTSETVYRNDKSEKLITITDGKACIEVSYRRLTADELDELAEAARVAVEELRALESAAVAIAAGKGA